MNKEMKQIEADVVIVFTAIENEVENGIVAPFWECDITTEDLHKWAQNRALQLCEQNGTGEMMYEIIDFRKVGVKL